MMKSTIPFYFLLFHLLALSQSLLHQSPQRVRYKSCAGSLSVSRQEEEDASDMEVSDAEALLACYAYLKRRKRIGNWAQKERRERMRASASPNLFWEEDFSRMAAKWQKGDLLWDDDDENNYDDEEGGEMSLRPRRSSNADEVWSGVFLSFPTDPSPTRTRRSQSAKRTWMDPDFRERWYQSRWGDVSQRDDAESMKEKDIEKRIRELPSGFLGSRELSDMTQDEIQEAIQSYINIQKKKSESHRKTLEKRKRVLKDQMKSIMAGNVSKNKAKDTRESFFVPSEDALREAQRKRSERAKALYQKRLKNQKTKRSKKETKTPAPEMSSHQTITRGITPKDAMLRIKESLKHGVLPTVSDVKTIMVPGKLRDRRNVLRRILSDFYDMRGKCVPSSGSSATELQFVTTCSIENLGAFVIDVMGDSASAREESASTRSMAKARPRTSESFKTPSITDRAADAMLRVEKQLNGGGVIPTADDMKAILKPKRLANRRQILQRIISDCFDMKGRCVPLGDSGKLESVTNSSVRDLGNLVLVKILEYERGNL
mmetsp:Transcript_24732/g.70961  ORF Transcript_24732/g.70961 Transcript_24732/m.70961 type:complete len:544 (+) Transcript_24732:68-1699(+)